MDEDLIFDNLTKELGLHCRDTSSLSRSVSPSQFDGIDPVEYGDYLEPTTTESFYTSDQPTGGHDTYASLDYDMEHGDFQSEDKFQVNQESTRKSETVPVLKTSPLAQSLNSSLRLIPVSSLPEPYGEVFRFGVFNVVQSKVLPTIYESESNAVISAPTGSGKTVVFELAILRMLEYDPNAKAVYMAPTKSLCGERYQDWSVKLSSLGVTCVLLTGDSENSSLKDAKLANIIITTPEKWDNMTRKWFDYPKVLSLLRLVCIDEVHMLCEERGSVLEVIVLRMKTLGTRVRLVALSATVPNIYDVAEWLGDGSMVGHGKANQGSAETFVFGEECRPVKISKFVYGFPRRQDQTEYQFMGILNFKTPTIISSADRLMDMIVSHSSGKPTLIFCGTRKSALQAAETISHAYGKMVESKSKLPWNAVNSHNPKCVSDKRLAFLISQGIGIHHAGLDWKDRACVEELFKNNGISVLCTTSTLAVGVNLPARSVIIRGTKTYKGGSASGPDGFENYSDLDLTQMMGRAGRPQFDSEGVAVIMTAHNDKGRIEDLVNSKAMLESWSARDFDTAKVFGSPHSTLQLMFFGKSSLTLLSLHRNLTEHINSEINIGTITNRETALRWIHNSFLAIRIKISENPKHYSIAKTGEQPGDRQLEDLVENTIKLLAKDGLIEDRDGEINPTDFGEIMSKHCLRHKTFLNLASLRPNSTTRHQLESVSKSEEFSTIRFRAGEVTVYNKINSNVELKYPISGKINQGPQKVMLLIQAILGGIPLIELKTESNNPQMESSMIWQHLPRICLVALTIAQRDVGAKSSLELERSVNAKAWEGSPWVLRQLDQIGEKSVKRLVESDIASIDQLRNTEASRIEIILDRNPPFGTKIVKQARSMPKFECTMKTLSEKVTPQGIHVTVQIAVGLSEPISSLNWKWKNVVLTATVLVLTNDHQWIEFRTIQVKLLSDTRKFTVQSILIKPSQALVTYVACQQIAGIGCMVRWAPSTPRENYPKPRVISADEAATADVLEGLGMSDLETSDEDVLDGSFRNARHECEKPPTRVGKPSQPTLSAKNPKNQFPVTKKSETPFSLPKKSAQLSASISDPTQAPGTILDNGRYKCGHKCKGTCQHNCCIHGMDKPSRKAKQPSHGKEDSTHLESMTLAAKPTTSLESTKLAISAGGNAAVDVGQLKRKMDFEENSDELSEPGFFFTRIEKSKINDAQSHTINASHSSKPPLSHAQLDHTLSQERDFLVRLGRSIENDSRLRGPVSETVPEKEHNSATRPLRESEGDRITPTSSDVLRFMNRKKAVDDFDEQAIFRKLKAGTNTGKSKEGTIERFPCRVVTKITPSPPEKALFIPDYSSEILEEVFMKNDSFSSPEPEKDPSDSRPSSPDIVVVSGQDIKKRKADELATAESAVAGEEEIQKTPLAEEEEVDELDEEYDLAIFAPYLASKEDKADQSAGLSQVSEANSSNGDDIQERLNKRARFDEHSNLACGTEQPVPHLIQTCGEPISPRLDSSFALTQLNPDTTKPDVDGNEDIFLEKAGKAAEMNEEEDRLDPNLAWIWDYYDQ